MCNPRPDLTEAVPVKLMTHTCPNKEEMQLYFNGELPGRPSWILDDGNAEEESDERLDGDANEWTGGGASGYSNETEMTRTTQHPLVGLFPIFLSARFFFILGLKAVPETERDCEVVAVRLGHGGAILQVEVLAPTCYPLPNPGGDWRLSTFFQVPEHLRGRVVQPKELLLLDGEYMDDVDENGDPYDCYEDELRADPNVLDPKGSLMRSSDMEDMAARAQAELSALYGWTVTRNTSSLQLYVTSALSWRPAVHCKSRRARATACAPTPPATKPPPRTGSLFRPTSCATWSRTSPAWVCATWSSSTWARV